MVLTMTVMFGRCATVQERAVDCLKCAWIQAVLVVVHAYLKKSTVELLLMTADKAISRAWQSAAVFLDMLDRLVL